MQIINQFKKVVKYLFIFYTYYWMITNLKQFFVSFITNNPTL